MRKSNMIAVSACALALAGGTAVGASAAGLVHSGDIATDAVTSRTINNGAVHNRDLSAKMKTKVARDSDVVAKGSVFRVENYKNGGGGSATVACADDEATSQKYTAIAGGVQGSTVAHQAADSFAVTSSFPGRMNWDTGEPKPNRLDGWIILGNSQYTGTLKVWALCVPTTSIDVQTVDLDN